MAGEQWAQSIIEQALNRTVVIHDDNSQSSMYDLRIGLVEAPKMAIEVVAAVDPVYTETWNLGPGQGPLRLAIKGDWTISIRPGARIGTIRRRLEALLRQLEARGVYTLHAGHFRNEEEDRLFDALAALGINRASCYRIEGTGIIYMSMPGSGGAVDTQGATLPPWVSAFLRDPKRADVLRKLDMSRAAERHVFIPVTLAGAPWSVESYLTDDLDSLPTAEPNLPLPVTGVWVVHTLPFSGRGIRWDRAGWHFFNARDESS